MSSTIVRVVLVAFIAVIAPGALPALSFGGPNEGRDTPADAAVSRPAVIRSAASAVVTTTPIDAAVRTNEPVVAGLLAQSASLSPTFQALLDRLRWSDVVVYVRTHKLPTTRDGQLTFMGTGGNRRYVLVNLAWGRSEPRLIATLAHELQHAVEIAERSDIIDAASLGRAFGSFGLSTIRGPGTTYETQRAIDTGARVLAEVSEEKRTVLKDAPELGIRP